MNIAAINEYAFKTYDAAKLSETITNNPSYLADHKTDSTQATFLAQIALNSAVSDFVENRNYQPFDIAAFEHVRDLATPIFEHVDEVNTDEPCLIWHSPWSIATHNAAEYALMKAIFSFETDERTVDLSALDEEVFALLKAVVATARKDVPWLDREFLIDRLGYYDEESIDAEDRSLFDKRLDELLA